ncbi:uncharacterized mitochondrial protein AtMg00310-like [Henckelia pumila]|uniref:uncharacterized mitochondrial protein AtMg00310-like n=1 Tax=Henckelia pumila TaxID=405737 RepID=UPI003C6E2A90
MDLTIPVVQGHNLYLGIPTVSLRSKRLQFKYLVERVVKHIQGWVTKMLLRWRIPMSFCEDIENGVSQFLVGVEMGKKKMHWKSWDYLCKPKLIGGLGFQKMDEFNRALIAQQLWCLLQNQDFLSFGVLKERYFKHGRLLEASLGSNP